MGERSLYRISNRVLSVADVGKIHEIDKIVYPKEHQSDSKQIMKRVSKNPDCFTVVERDKQIIGYMCYFPITENLRLRILYGDLETDANIEPEDITDYDVDNVVLYIISIAIIPDYQGTDVIKDLMRGFKQRLEDLKQQGVNLKEILAIAITEKGYNTLLKAGFEEVMSKNDRNI